MVDVTKIEIGKIYKYGELCETFGEERKSSNSKKSQLKEWERFFRWQNITAQKYRIEEIYDIPKEKMDGRKSNGGNSTSKYLAMDDCIMKLLQKRKEFNSTIGMLLEEIGLLMVDYHLHKRNSYYFTSQGFSRGVVNNLFWKMTSVERTVKASIERLRRDKYLSRTIETVLIREDHSSDILMPVEIKAEKEMKQQIMIDMKIQNNDLYDKEKKKEFDRRYKIGLQNLFGDDASYIFQRYHLTYLEKEYAPKSQDGIDGLTRKFVREICIYMIKLDYKEFYQKENTARQVVGLLEKLFVHMDEENWNCYIDEDFETEMEMVFFTQFYMVQGSWRKNGRVVFEEKKDDSYRIGIKTKTDEREL